VNLTLDVDDPYRLVLLLNQSGLHGLANQIEPQVLTYHEAKVPFMIEPEECGAIVTAKFTKNGRRERWMRGPSENWFPVDGNGFRWSLLRGPIEWHEGKS
jgi:hypothetical protein